jgi:hypothetical protein
MTAEGFHTHPLHSIIINDIALSTKINISVMEPMRTQSVIITKASDRIPRKEDLHDGTLLNLTTDWTTGVRSRQRQRIFLLSSASRPALGPTQPPIQWVPEVLSPGVKRGRGVMLTTHPHLVPKVKNE